MNAKYSEYMHTRLSARLEQLRRQYGVVSKPLTWIVNRCLEPDYLTCLAGLAPLYGVHRIGLTDDPDELSDRFDNVILMDTADVASFDAAKLRFGQGTLPYLSTDDLADSTYITVDTPETTCLHAPAWLNVAAVSMFAYDSTLTLDDVIRTVFVDAADDVCNAFSEARQAVEKAFQVDGRVQLLENSHWPVDMGFYNRQLDVLGDGDELKHPTRKTLIKIDHEKIDAMQHAHLALSTLEQARERLGGSAFLHLEHYFQNLKIVCTVLRRLTNAVFCLRAGQNVTPATLIGKLKDLRAAVRVGRTTIAHMPSSNAGANARRMDLFIESCRFS